VAVGGETGRAYFLKAFSPKKIDARMTRILAAATTARSIRNLREQRYRRLNLSICTDNAPLG
jgi:hypothetical protein